MKYKETDSEGRTSGISSRVSLSKQSSFEGIQIIKLSEKVNPIELADELRQSGFGAQIEYIQPDFDLGYASFQLELVDDSSSDESDVEETDTIETPDLGDTLLEDNSTEESDESTDEPEETEGSLQNNVIVAVIDTGVDSTHSMLSGYMLPGWDFVTNSQNTYDPNKPSAYVHGTNAYGGSNCSERAELRR